MRPAAGPAQPLDGEAPEWVHILPAGRFSGADGRGPYQADTSSLLAEFTNRAKGRPLLIDFSHQSMAAAGSTAGTAAGWVVEMQARDDGLWGRVEWTPAGRKALKNKDYRYLSPVFRHTANGTITSILNAGLVNNPNLSDLAPVLNSAAPHSDEDEPVTIASLLRKGRDESVPDLDTIMAGFGLPAPETTK